MRPDSTDTLWPQAATALRALLLAAAWRVTETAQALLDEAVLAERFGFLQDHAAAFEALRRSSGAAGVFRSHQSERLGFA